MWQKASYLLEIRLQNVWQGIKMSGRALNVCRTFCSAHQKWFWRPLHLIYNKSKSVKQNVDLNRIQITPLLSMTPTTHYQSFLQYDTDYTLPILLSVWTTHYQSFIQYDTYYTLPIPLHTWPCDSACTLPVWHRLPNVINISMKFQLSVSHITLWFSMAELWELLSSCFFFNSKYV